MRLVESIRAALARVVIAAQKLGHLYLVGGPVGVLYALKLALIKRRIATVSEYIIREKELNRANLAALNYELTQLVAKQQGTSAAAAQFWNWCEKKAGVQP
jgi:hypothetical protein